GVGAGDLDALAQIFAEALGIGFDDKIDEQLLKLRALGLVGRAPVATEDELRNRGHIEAIKQQLAEARVALRPQDCRTGQFLEGIIAQLLNERGGARLASSGRLRDRDCPDEEQSRANRAKCVDGASTSERGHCQSPAVRPARLPRRYLCAQTIES